MHYETGLLVLMFIILALVVGAGVRYALKGTQVPYTVALLIIGLLAGLAHRGELFHASLPLLSHTMDIVADISPHLILFIFLPTLIFESAFAMEAHLFRRMFMQIALLAVPGLILATLLTAGLVKWTFPWDWSWAVCLMFGALISATDPVAVVALLKEVSSRKRLETLIEGESLLNDGTAIVFFSLFYAWVISVYSGNQIIDFDLLSISGEFIYVVLFGCFVGALLSWICISWIGRVFNDPLIEITLTIATAYAAFFIAESMHVSGVVAVVTFALLLASFGRTRISPEVGGFLHHFWEMMAHIANTLIFLLVGIVVAIRVPLNDLDAWQALGILYLGILVIRGLSILVFMPLLKRSGVGINAQKATVLWWGGLRGAVSLALALTVAANDLIPADLSHTILFLCAGIVVLTILVNGSTMGLMLKWLHLDSLPPAKQATVDKAKKKIYDSLNQLLPSLMDNDLLKDANWQDVKQTIEIESMDTQLLTVNNEDLVTAFHRRLLETERKHYWQQFEQGTLGKTATQRLVDAVEHALDGQPCIGPRTELFQTHNIPKLLNVLQNFKWGKHWGIRFYFKHLALSYDVARGFLQAQNALGSHIDELAPDQTAAQDAHKLVADNKDQTFAQIDLLRTSFPEIIKAIQSQTAIRLLLNRERKVIQEQLKNAVLDTPEASRLLDEVESRMIALQKISILKQTQTDQFLTEITWANSLSAKTQEELTRMLSQEFYEAGQTVFNQGEDMFGIGLISRGRMKCTTSTQGQNHTEHLGQGESFGALSLLTGKSPANLQADSPVDVLWLPGDKLKQLMKQDSELAKAISLLMN
ncbi:MAG: cation:proton antiporter [Gammaproteobacteria bacterium]|nr:cation:proton antiporter [Gammaproteobacteria bacterium]